MPGINRKKCCCGCCRAATALEVSGCILGDSTKPTPNTLVVVINSDVTMNNACFNAGANKTGKHVGSIVGLVFELPIDQVVFTGWYIKILAASAPLQYWESPAFGGCGGVVNKNYDLEIQVTRGAGSGTGFGAGWNVSGRYVDSFGGTIPAFDFFYNGGPGNPGFVGCCDARTLANLDTTLTAGAPTYGGTAELYPCTAP